MLRLRTPAIGLAVAGVLCACGRVGPAESPAPPSAATVGPIAQVAAALPSAARDQPDVPATAAAPIPHAAVPWPSAEMRDPDPRMRRFALEQWAREPTESLDLVAAALADPEESIRERAEQVFEEVLARRR